MNKQDIQTVLNALQNSQLFVQASSNINVLEGFGQQLDDADEAIALLRAFLAEPSEPVAEVAGDYNTKHIIFLPAGIALEVGDKLFTHPAPSKPEPGEETAVQTYTRLADDAEKSSQVLLKMYGDSKNRHTPRRKALWDGYWHCKGEAYRLKKLLADAIAHELSTGVAL